jgi:hypothetical protein
MATAVGLAAKVIGLISATSAGRTGRGRRDAIFEFLERNAIQVVHGPADQDSDLGAGLLSLEYAAIAVEPPDTITVRVR